MVMMKETLSCQSPCFHKCHSKSGTSGSLLICILFGIWFFTVQVYSAELPESGLSIRALGMGNAYTAVVDNYEALWYNPAALGRVKGINATLLDINAGLNGENAYKSSQELSTSTAQGLDKYNTIFGDQLSFGAGLKLAVVTPYFGVGAYDSMNGLIELRNPTLPEFNIGAINDMGFIIGTAFPIGPSSYMGINAKKIIRSGNIGAYGISKFLDGNTSSQIEPDLNRKGSGYGGDIGFVVTLPVPLNPTFSGVWKDIGYTAFNKEPGYLAPPRIKDERILGMAAGFDVGIIDMTAAVDYKHINENTENIGKKIHMGLEIGLPLIDIRGGFSQGYYTMGATIDLWLMRFELAYYGVELGEYPGQDEDRRIQAQLIIDIGFDPNLNFLDFNKSKKRKLKQRR
jgi:hypothetical protein